ncbi:MAG: coproporphyrinogen III oxidase family protein [Coriobacteriia bacterium]|nr:coproporphyrinogen III oxidase family protein [Coriobacteriia bacterium]
MLSERLLTNVMRRASGSYLRLEETALTSLPAPIAGRECLLYVHVPFCERLCPYCSFNRFPYHAERATAYFAHLRDEMRMVADLGYDFGAMYVGGGTPTVDVGELAKTIDLAKELFTIREVSSETNPNHLYPQWMDPLLDRVDRLSVGVQSFDDGLLKQMDRYDKYGSAEQIVERLKSIEGTFHSMNVDMIFNFPSQTPEMLANDLEVLKNTGCNQTTFYPLMASPVVEESLRRTVGKVDYAREGRYYHTIAEGLAERFEPASAWTFSRTGGGMIDEYIVDYEDYVGIGSGAFSFLDGALYVNTFSLEEYAERISSGVTAAVRKKTFARRDLMRYRMLMGLFGLILDRRAFVADFGVDIERGLPIEIAFLRGAGAFSVDNAERLELTQTGRYLLVAMMREFFIGVNSVRDQARSALSGEERKLLFGDGAAACGSDGEQHPLAQAAAQTEDAEFSPR